MEDLRTYRTSPNRTRVPYIVLLLEVLRVNVPKLMYGICDVRSLPSTLRIDVHYNNSTRLHT